MFDTSRIHPMLDKVQTYLGKWLEGHLKQIYPTDWWERCVMSVLVPEQREHVLDDGAQTPEDLDLAMQITVFRGNWNLLRRKFHLNPQLYDDAAAVKRIRNKYSHKKSGKDYEERFEHDMETVKLFLKGLGAQNNLLNENLLTGLNENGIYGNQRNRNNQENVIMSYRDRVNGIKPISFRAVIDVAHQALPNSIRRAPWIGLEHGIVPLNTEQKLDQYLAAYGKMHVEKIRMSFGALETPSEDLRAPVSVVDWGCGQALATCSLFDWLLEDNNIGMGCIRRIHLIEPSNLAMERACINVDVYQRQYNANFDVKRINKLISDVQQDDFKIEGIQTNVHLLSNILDIETVDLDFLAEFIKHNFTGRQIFFCVGPLNQGASRIKEFAIKLGIPESDILSRCQGRLAQQHGTISMLTFIIDEGGASAKKIEFVPMAPVSVQDNIALQRVLKRYEAKQDVLDRITQFYQMATELEQIKEPSVRESTSFIFKEDNGTLSVSFADNNDFLVRCQENANPAITRWPKDLHFGFDVIWGADAYRLLYYIKPMDELRDVNFATDTIDLKLRDFAVSIGCAESLELTDDKINIIEQHLHSDEVSWKSLGELLERVIGTGVTLSTTQINVSFCDRNIALAQIYSELKRMDSYEIRRSQLLTAFLENAEIDNTVDSVLPEELINVVPMDKSQCEAVCNALNSRVSVVVGPPGCGKTQLILNLLANSVVRGKKVLVASKNNKAVDNVKDRFSVFDPNGCFLRFGKKEYVRDVTIPAIQGHLNRAQVQIYDDQPYSDMIAQYNRLMEFLHDKSSLEQELVSMRQIPCDAEGRIAKLKESLDKYPNSNADVVNSGAQLRKLLNEVEYQLSGLKGLFTRCFGKGKIANTVIGRIIDFPREVQTYLHGIDNRDSISSFRSCNDVVDYCKHCLEALNDAIDTPQKIRADISAEEERKDFAVKRAEEIVDELERGEGLARRVSKIDFGRQLVSLAIDHYLHAGDSARAITAYKAYLPDDIPRRREEMSAFYHAAEKFLDVFRLESVTSLSVKSAFPLKEELFDMLVIDEASQCDVASALPLILRAKQVVVIGDPMQLRHISRVEPEEELAIKRHLNLSGAVHLKYADASLWDYTRNWLPWCENARPCVLENHYRCHPNIIGYSNEMFYNTLTFGGLNVCTANRPNDGTPQGIIWKDIRGTQVNGSTNVNVAEVNEVIRAAVAYANGNPRLTIGIVTPFSAQAERINKRIPTQLRGRIVADTVHKFQGDEKDVMIYSLVVTDNSPDGKIKWIDYKVPNLVNVAVTRAKQLLVIVGNKTYIRNHSRSNLPLGHLVAYVDRVNAPGNNENGIRR